MHPLRLLLLISVALAFAVAAGFGSALDAAGVAPGVSIFLAITTFVAFMIPWSAVTFWVLRRAADFNELNDRTREVVEGQLERSLTDRRFHGELDELARWIEELRATLVRQRQAFDEHRAAMEEIVASLGEGILSVNRAGKVVFANRRAGEMFGVESPSLVGRTILEVARKPSLADAVEKALQGSASVERITLGRGDQERQVEVRTFPVASSAEMAAVALFIDVTTIERLQRIRRNFLDDFSHEVRTPLAGLRSASDTLERGGLPREQELQLRHVMHRQIARIERLVQDLSELNQIESGQVVLQRRPVALRQLVQELCEEMVGTAPGTTFRIEGDEVVALLDRPRAQQVLTNLVDNACKHGQGEIRIELSRDNGEAVIRVSDEGPGIPPAELDRVFHRFHRVDRSRSQPGTGLGLAIAKHLVVAHGGTIRAFNRPTGGATFEVRLPVG